MAYHLTLRRSCAIHSNANKPEAHHDKQKPAQTTNDVWPHVWCGIAEAEGIGMAIRAVGARKNLGATRQMA